MDEAFTLGVDAYHNCASLEDNPYAVRTSEADDWAYGYEYARQEMLYLDNVEWFENHLEDNA